MKILNAIQIATVFYIIGIAGASDNGASIKSVMLHLVVAVAVFAITAKLKKSALLEQRRTSL